MTIQLNDFLPAPNLVGLPERFGVWRRNQAEAVVRALDSDKRFIVLGMPTGFGKSLVYMACAMLGEPTVILTSTKGLQSQLLTDFEGSGLADIRGMANYDCLELQHDLFGRKVVDRAGCDEGPCLAGWDCPKASSGCHYFDGQRYARAAHVTVTNYSYWMAVNSQQGRPDGKLPPLGKRGMLVLDEAHAAVDELGDHLAIEIGHWEVEGLLGSAFPATDSLEEWRRWARTLVAGAESEIDHLSEDVRRGGADRTKLRRLRELRDLSRRLFGIATGRGQWVHESTRDRRGRRVVRFDPVWPGEYAESSLFLGVPKVVLTSATIRPKTLELLGVKEADYAYIEYPSSFPVSRRPFIWCPTVRVRYDMHPGHARQWVAKIDKLLDDRADRKGIIHTVSYSRRDYLLRYSRNGHRFIVHNSGGSELSRAVERYNDMPASAGPVLVSPSVGTGFDFPGDRCRYQIIGKVPFPDSRSVVLKARQERDPDFFAYVAAQNLVQMAGRGVRSADDWCETIVVDDNWQWFVNKYGQRFMPKWFLSAVSKCNTVPEPIDG